MYILLLNVMDADPQATMPQEVLLGFIDWVYQHTVALRDQVRKGNIDLG